MNNQQQRFSPIDDLVDREPRPPSARGRISKPYAPEPECFELPIPTNWVLPSVFVIGAVLGYLIKGWIA